MLDLSELAEQCLDGSLDIALEDDVEVLDDALLQLRQAFERNATLRALCELLAPEAPCPLLGDVLCEALVLDDARELACGGGRSKPRISTGSPGRASRTFSPL